MKKIKTLLVLSGLAVSVLAGCGTQTTTSTPATTSNPTSESTTSSEAKVLTGIRIAAEPTKKDYFVGDEFDPAGLQVKAVYTTGEEDLAAADYQLSGFDSATAGEKTITVTFETQTATFKVNVAEVVLTGIRIAGNPTKVAYYQGEEFDAAGIQVKAVFNNGSERDVAAADLAFSGFDGNNPGEQTITVTYQEKTATFNVNVIAQNGIEITAAPKKVRYGVGEEFDATGLKVSRTFADGGKKELAEGEFTYAGFDSTTKGEKTITVTAGTYTAEFKVNVYNNDWSDEEKATFSEDLIYELPYFFGFELKEGGITSTQDPDKKASWYEARTDFAVTEDDLEDYADAIESIKITTTGDDGQPVEEIAWKGFALVQSKTGYTDDVDLLGFSPDSEVYQYTRQYGDAAKYNYSQVLSIGLDNEGKLLAVTTICNFPYRGYGYEGKGYMVNQNDPDDGPWNLVKEIYFDIMDTRAEETFEAVSGYTGGLEIPETPDGSFCYYFCDATNSPYVLSNAYSDFFDIATCALVFAKGEDVDYTQDDLNAILTKYRDRGIEVVEDSTTYTVTVYDLAFEYAGYKLKLEYYIINGLIRLEIAFDGYEIPAKDYTAEEVANDINAAFASNGYTFGLEWDDEYKQYDLLLNFGAASTASEALLANAVDILASYFPAYLKQKAATYNDPKSDDFVDIFGDGRATYVAIYETPDAAVKAEIVSYINSGKLMGMLIVYNVADVTD